MGNRKLLTAALWALLLFYVYPAVKADMTGPEVLPAAPEPAPADRYDDRTLVTVKNPEEVVTMPLSRYLEGVLMAELPASFPEEAWKAQAVAARSYAIRKLQTAPPDKHRGAALCTDYSCCTAFLAEADLPAWSGSRTLLEKARTAVRATDGLAAVHGGEVISAVWHSASADWTAASEQVWGGEVAYLREVRSPGGSDSPSYYNERILSRRELLAELVAACPEGSYGEDPASWLTEPEYSKGGYLISVRVGGVAKRGLWLRTALELPSAAVTWQGAGDRITFSTVGTGHGVGMSQYGAARMAADGADFQTILTHYYTGVQLMRLQ